MGIAAIQSHIPSARLTVEEISLRSGVPTQAIRQKIFTQKPVHSESKSILELGLRAAKALLERTAIDPRDVGMLVHASSGVHDHGLWSPAARLQSELGLPNAYCFEIVNGCHAGTLALQTVSRALSEPGSARYGLIIVCDALSRLVDHADPAHVSLFNFADAATAILVDREPNGPRILSHCNRTEGDFSEYLRLGPRGKIVYAADRSKSALKEAYLRNYTRVIRETLSRANRRAEDLKHVLISQGDPQLFPQIAAKLGLNEKKIFRSSDHFGHLGGSDVFFALEQLLRDGDLSRGDLVLLASSAIGFSWGAVLLEV